MSFRRATSSIYLLIVALTASFTALAQSTDRDRPTVTMRTSAGDMVIELDAARAPQTVENFLAYVDDSFYTDTVFHRVIEGFMIQGGGFSTSYQRKTTRPPVSNEAYNGLRNKPYTIAMARTTEPHSATSQFFINSADNSNLDHTGTTQRGWGYTVFGKVVQGKEIVDAISRVRTSAGGPFSRDVPVQPIIILGVERWAPADSDEAKPAAGTQAESAEPVEGAAAANPADGVIQNAQARAKTTRLDMKKVQDTVSSELVKQN